VSPFESSAALTGAGVASLSLGVDVAGLIEPIRIRMPLRAAPATAPAPAASPNASAAAAARNNSAYTRNGSSAAPVQGGSVTAVDTCQYWDHELGAWDGRGCIAEGMDGGFLVCHCFHLTEFGGVGSLAIPKMNVVDPTDPGEDM
jgi:hypothetical protein